MATKKLQILGSFGDNITVDSTLTQAGLAADAKATGDAINHMQANVDDMNNIDYDNYLAFDITEIV